MSNLLLLLLFIFGGVALMAVLVERFAKPMEEEQVGKFSRWIIPLAALAIIIQLIYFYF